MRLAGGVDKAHFLTDFQPLEPDGQGDSVGIAVFGPEADGFDRVARVIQVHDEFLVCRLPLDDIAEGRAFGVKIRLAQTFQRRGFRAIAHGVAPCRAKGAFVHPVRRKTEGQFAEFAEQEVAEGVVAVLIQGEAGFSGPFAQPVLGRFGDAIQHAEEEAHLFLAPAPVRAGHSQKGGVPGDLRTGRHVMVAHDLASAFQKLEHVREQVNVALLERAFLRGGGGPARHGVAGHVVVCALEVGRAVAVVVGDDLLEHIIGGARHVAVEVHGQAEFFLDIGGRGQRVALTVGSGARAQVHVHNVRASRGGRAHRGHEQPVRGVAVVVQHKGGPALAQGLNQRADEARRADAGHVLQPEDDLVFRLAFPKAAHLAAQADHGGDDFKVVIDGEAPRPGKGHGRLEHHIPAAHDHFGQGAHVFHMIEKVETADNMVIVADRFARKPHEAARLRAVAEHVGGADEDLLERFRGEGVPGPRLGEGVGHVRQHGDMKMRAAAVFERKEAALVQVGADKFVFGQAEAVAAVGLGGVAGGGVRKVDAPGVAHIVKQGETVAVRVGRGRPSRLGRQRRQDDGVTGQARRVLGAVFTELHMRVVPLGGNFGHQPGQTFAFRREIRVHHEFGRGSDKARGEVPGLEARVAEDLAEEGDRRLQTAHGVFREGAGHDPEHFLPVVAVGDEQGACRVVIGREVVAGGQVGVDAHARPAGRDVAGHQTGIGGKVVLRVLAVDAHLHGDMGGHGFPFLQAEFRAEGHGDLLFHKVHAVAAFGDAVLHLEARVDLDEEGFAFRRDQKFDCRQGIIPHFAHQHPRVFLEAGAQIRGDARPGRGRDFHKLLVVALDGAIPLVKGEDVAVLVRNDLNFDVPDVFEEFFHIQARIAERRLRHGGRLEKGVFQFGRLAHQEDPAPAPAAFGLEHDGQADLPGRPPGRGHVHRSVRAGNNGNAEPFGQLAHPHLVAQQLHRFFGRADEGDAGLFAFSGKAFVFRSETPAGVDGDDPALPRLGNDQIEIEISPRIGAEQKKFLRGGSGRRGLVDIRRGHDGHGREAFADGAADAARRNAPVGDKNRLAPYFVQHLFKRFDVHVSYLNSEVCAAREGQFPGEGASSVGGRRRPPERNTRDCGRARSPPAGDRRERRKPPEASRPSRTPRARPDACPSSSTRRTVRPRNAR